MQARHPIRGALAPLLVVMIATVSAPAAAEQRPGLWEGAYWGLSLVLAGKGDDRIAVAPPGGEQGKLSLAGALGAAQIGWRDEAQGLVWGVEADLQLGRVADSFTALPYSASSRISQVGSLRLLAGLPAGQAGLIYLTGGIAMAKLDYAVSSTDGLDIADTGYHAGYALGAGYEMALASGWSARLEYQYASFGKTTLWDGASSTEATPDYHALKIGLNHRF